MKDPDRTDLKLLERFPFPVWRSGGAFAGYLGACFDVTGCKQAEGQAAFQALLLDQVLHAFMDKLPGFAWMKDARGRYAYVNSKVTAQLPELLGDLLGKADAELWPAEIAAHCQANDQQVIAHREALQTVEPY